MILDPSETPGLLYALALAATVAVCIKAGSLGEWLKVIAYPDGLRRRHEAATPQMGGVAILTGMTIWLTGMLLLGGGGAERPLLSAILLCAIGVGLVGFTDDQCHISPMSRIAFLCVFCGIAATINPGFVTQTLYWASFDSGHISTWAYCALTGLAVIGLINAVNMADGQDGVVGSMFAVWSTCLMLVTTGSSQHLAALMLGASLVFLAFNLTRRMFLGDCGTYGVTVVFAMLAIVAHARGQVQIETVVVWFFIPVMDCLRLIISRPLRGRSPLNGDRDHFHHRLEDKLGKKMGLAVYSGAVACSSLITTLEPKFALLCFAVLAAFYFSFAWLTDSSTFAVQETEEKAVPKLKVVSLPVDGKTRASNDQ
jgi:UDP-GlcNAc:undecaprenyl-phosphate GlcNAc-1-phosphate transferase